MQQPLLVQFGAGNIGRSLVGQLFSAAGWKVVFLDVADETIDALNARGCYEVTIKDRLPEGKPPIIRVDNVSGINLKNEDEAATAIAQADIVGTSVGAANLASACRLVAKVLPVRKKPLSVLLCENLHGAAALAKQYAADALPHSHLAETIGFVEAAISKMVPSTPAEVRKADPLTVWAEAYNTLYLDADAFIGTPPRIPGIAWRRPFAAYVDRKLFLHNFGHAAAAYNGFQAGKRFIWECMEDKAVRAETEGCMMETARALSIRHADVFTYDENKAWADDLLRRFGNKALADTVFRVGRDLKRKLGPDDRCIGALRLLAKNGLPHRHTARTIAAGLRFFPEDEQGGHFPGDEEIVSAAKKHGPEQVLESLCGLNRPGDAPLVTEIAQHYRTRSGNS